MLKLSNIFKNPSMSLPTNSKLQLHMDEPTAVAQISNYIIEYLHHCPKKADPIIICIGTDRSTGDSLGPLCGWRLTSLFSGTNENIFGTIDSPVHANNLVATLKHLKNRMPDHPIIAIDACLGQKSKVGTIIVDNTPLRPGTGVRKDLPPVGDVSISGIVNLGGYMEFQVLQSTRLSIIFKMSHVIANGLFLGLRAYDRSKQQPNINLSYK